MTSISRYLCRENRHPSIMQKSVIEMKKALLFLLLVLNIQSKAQQLTSVGPLSISQIADFMVTEGEISGTERNGPLSLYFLNSRSHLGNKGVAPYKISDWLGYKMVYTGTGGTITTDGLYRVHTFTSSGTFTINAATTVEVLVVAGGGGGGEGHGGGGGAGGLIHVASFAVAAGTYPVTVGLGGALSNTGSDARGNPGGNSVFSTLTAIGGGYGSTWEGGNGGSGGGSSCWVNNTGTLGTGSGKGTAGQGNDGGPVFQTPDLDGPGQGGGGAGTAGKSGSGASDTQCIGGNGGAGSTYSISGSAVTYAGGGGGGGAIGIGIGGSGGGGNGGMIGVNAISGTANTGGGGGGGGAIAQYPARIGAAGGSGVVVIRYLY